jgi:hypothetical protein
LFTCSLEVTTQYPRSDDYDLRDTKSRILFNQKLILWPLDTFQTGLPAEVRVLEDKAAFFASQWRNAVECARKNESALTDPRSGKMDGLLSLKIPGIDSSTCPFFDVPKTQNRRRDNTLLPPIDHHSKNSSDLTANATHELISRNSATHLNSSLIDGKWQLPSVERKYSIDNHLHLPLLGEEHKHFHATKALSSVQQGRFFATTALKYLASLGIFNFPTFTLVTEGTQGIIICAFCIQEPLSSSDVSYFVYQSQCYF